MDVDWLRENEELHLKANSEELSTGDQSKYIVFVSTHALRQGRFKNACQRPEAF
jgi:hypothetical protein